MTNETEAGRLARTWPELGRRERGALLSENASTQDPRERQRALRDRCEDAACAAWAR